MRMPAAAWWRSWTRCRKGCSGRCWTSAPDGARGQGHYVDGPRRSFAGGAGLVSTARDYARLLQMLLNGGELAVLHGARQTIAAAHNIYLQFVVGSQIASRQSSIILSTCILLPIAAQAVADVLNRVRGLLAINGTIANNHIGTQGDPLSGRCCREGGGEAGGRHHPCAIGRHHHPADDVGVNAGAAANVGIGGVTKNCDLFHPAQFTGGGGALLMAEDADQSVVSQESDEAWDGTGY